MKERFFPPPFFSFEQLNFKYVSSNFSIESNLSTISPKTVPMLRERTLNKAFEFSNVFVSEEKQKNVLSSQLVVEKNLSSTCAVRRTNTRTQTYVILCMWKSFIHGAFKCSRHLLIHAKQNCTHTQMQHPYRFMKKVAKWEQL